LEWGTCSANKGAGGIGATEDRRKLRTPARVPESASSPANSKRPRAGVEVIRIWSSLSSIVGGVQGVSIRSRQYKTAVHGGRGRIYRLLEREGPGTERGVTTAVGLHAARSRSGPPQ
jgi:hypothetical protein